MHWETAASGSRMIWIFIYATEQPYCHQYIGTVLTCPYQLSWTWVVDTVAPSHPCLSSAESRCLWPLPWNTAYPVQLCSEVQSFPSPGSGSLPTAVWRSPGRPLARADGFHIVVSAALFLASLHPTRQHQLLWLPSSIHYRWISSLLVRALNLRLGKQAPFIWNYLRSAARNTASFTSFKTDLFNAAYTPWNLHLGAFHSLMTEGLINDVSINLQYARKKVLTGDRTDQLSKLLDHGNCSARKLSPGCYLLTVSNSICFSATVGHPSGCWTLVFLLLPWNLTQNLDLWSQQDDLARQLS